MKKLLILLAFLFAGCEGITREIEKPDDGRLNSIVILVKQIKE